MLLSCKSVDLCWCAHTLIPVFLIMGMGLEKLCVCSLVTVSITYGAFTGAAVQTIGTATTKWWYQI